MSTFWKVLLLILLNIIVSASVTYGVLYYWENVREPKTQYQLVTLDGNPEILPDLTDPEPTESITAETDHTEIESTPEEETTETVDPTPVIRGARVEISIIRNPGNLSGEALRIVSNADEIVSLEGWRLEDANGNVLTFPNIQLLRKGVFVEVYSRAGHPTPYEIFWNCNEPVWQSGETAVLKDVFGQIQATYRVP
ncbi:MAG: lamin tail domain-containing protein [Anaerolineaceae bacterium]|nr:lamin tail domain-containing protein [Anaerolineaceae bacterium]